MEVLKDKWLWFVAAAAGVGFYMLYKQDKEDNSSPQPLILPDDMDPFGDPMSRTEIERIVDSQNDFLYGDDEEDF